MTLSEFFNRLEEATFGLVDPTKSPPRGWTEWVAFRRQAEEREEAGRDRFGDAYLLRDNAGEGLEEAVDGANYGYFDVERTRSEGGDVDEALQLALVAAQHFYEGYSALHRLQARTPALPISEPESS